MILICVMHWNSYIIGSMRKNKFVCGFLLLLTISFSAADSGKSLIFLSQSSGSYNRDILLNGAATQRESRFEYSFKNSGGWGPWLHLREGLNLTAVSGEERRYQIRVSAVRRGEILEQRELDFVIDKRKPRPPQLIIAESGCLQGTEINFSAYHDELVYYAVNSLVTEHGKLWERKPIPLELKGERAGKIFVQAYSQDKAGNRSSIKTFNLTIDLCIPFLEILSPAPGNFANTQILYINSRNTAWVKYTLDGSDPAARGFIYTGPKSIERTGNIKLRVAALPLQKGKELIRREVVFEVAAESKLSLSCDRESGLYKSGLKVGITHNPGNKVFYTLSEKTPTAADYAFLDVIALDSIPFVSKSSVLRLRVFDQEGKASPEYRYFYIIDRSKPSAPAISVKESNPLAAETEVELKAAGNTKIYYTLDGTLPGTSTMLYKRAFTISPPAESANILVRAIAVNPLEVASDISQYDVEFDTQPPEPPEVQLSTDMPTNKPVKIRSKSPAGSRTLFEISSDGSEPAPVSADSPEATGEMILFLPRGMARIFKLRFASIDAAGNISESDELVTVEFDSEPPACPELAALAKESNFDHSIDIAVEGNKRVYYELTADGSTPQDPTIDSSEYQGPITLSGRDKQFTRYLIKMLCLDDLGNTGEVEGPYTFNIDLRKPELPVIKGLTDEKIYNRKEVVFSLSDPDANIRYTFTDDGSEPADPTGESPIINERLIFKGEEESVKEFKLKVLPFSPGMKLQGDIKSFRFTIDLKPPALPELTGFEEGKRYKNGVKITMAPADKDHQIYFSYSESFNTLLDPITHGEPYREAITFDIEEGAEQSIFLRAAAVDQAGNRSLGDQYGHFILDKKPPLQPFIEGIVDNNISRESVSISFSTDEGKIYYEISEDGTTPPIPNLNSTLYHSPIVLTGRAKEEVTYRIIARAADSLGNFSPAEKSYTLLIDRKEPDPPDEPDIQLLGDEADKKYFISWNIPAGNRLYYRLNKTGEEPGRYVLYSTSFMVKTAPVRSYLESYYEDDAGNRSDSVSFALPDLKSRLTAPVISGIEHNGIYRGRISLKITAQKGRIHYELTADGMEPQPVSASSPRVLGPIILDSENGETLQFKIRAKTLSSDGSSLPSEEVYAAFTLDRTPPEAPVITGVENNGYYHKSVSFGLVTVDKGDIYYSVISNELGVNEQYGDKEEQASVQKYLEYKGMVEVDVAEGARRLFQISAYTVDEAGNKSRRTKNWVIAIDKKSYYVSEKGNDLFTGIRNKPFKTLHKAIAAAEESGRKLILISMGEFYLDWGLELPEGLRIIGGFNPDTWERELFERRTVLDAGSYFKQGGELLKISGGEILLESLELKDSRAKCRSLVTLESGTLMLKDVKVSLDRRQQGSIIYGIFQSGGSLKIYTSEFTADNVYQGAFIYSTGGDLLVKNSSFNGPHSSEIFQALLIAGNDANNLSGLTVRPGNGRRVSGINAVNASLTITGSTLFSGIGKETAAALDLRNSQIMVRDVRIQGEEQGNYTIGIIAKESRIQIESSTIIAAARYGARGLYIDRGSLIMKNSNLIGRSTPEFLYLVEMNSAAGSIYNNIMTGNSSGDSISVILTATNGDWFNNTIISGSGSNLTVGFMIKGADRSRFINNIILRRKRERGIAFYQVGGKKAKLSILANNLSGWEDFLVLDPLQGEKKIRDIEKLNHSDGDIFNGYIHGNIEEDYRDTFSKPEAEDFKLKASSRCVNGGVDLSKREFSGPGVDMEGQSRPAPLVGIKPAYDIGADELY